MSSLIIVDEIDGFSYILTSNWQNLTKLCISYFQWLIQTFKILNKFVSQNIWVEIQFVDQKLKSIENAKVDNLSSKLLTFYS